MSQLKVNCPFCQKELLIQNEHLGSQMTCPICGGTFFVPAPQRHAEIMSGFAIFPSSP